METMRDLLRKNLRRSLGALPEVDRLAAAWPVACGRALAEKGEIVSYAGGVVRVEVWNSVWVEQMRSMGAVLERELQRISGVRVDGIHFEVRRMGEGRPGPERVR